MSDLISKEEVKKLLESMEAKSAKMELSTDQKIKKLEELLPLYLREEEFKVGDIVYWKEGLKNRKFPQQFDPAIVVEVVHAPFTDSTSDSGNPSFREMFGIKLGILVETGDELQFIMFYYDKNRFTKIPPTAA